MSLVHAPELQVDIFVTNIQPSPSSSRPLRAPSQSAGELLPLAPPVARFTEENRSRPESPDVSDDEAYGGLVDLSYYTGEDVQHEENGWDDGGQHELDLTNFDGDDDTQLPGEAQLNHRFKKEGMIRRAKSRKVARAHRAPSPESPESDLEQNGTSTYSKRVSAQSAYSQRSSMHSTVRLLPPQEAQHAAPRRPKPPLEVDIASASSPWISSPLSPTGLSGSALHPKHHPRITSPHRPESPFPSASSLFDSRSDVSSVYAMMPQTGVGAYGEEVKIDFDVREIHDVSVIAEHARPGRPKLDRLLAEEVANSRGSVIVACKFFGAPLMCVLIH